MHNACVHVSGLFVYPIKSAAALSRQSVPLDDFGLAHDREYMVVDPSGRFLTQREIPRLALVRPELTDSLVIHTPVGSAEASPGDSLMIRVWDFRGPAVDCGDEASDLLARHLGRPCRLVRVTPGHLRTSPGGGRVGFADGFPLLITATASLADLNDRMSAPVPMDRFRPNIVVTTDTPWIEDQWREIEIGAVPIDVVKPCARCTMIRVDQAAGERMDTEPLATLAQFRQGPEGVEFGQNAIHRGPGTLSVGDRLSVTSAQY